jgi:hypothetical protein
VKTTPVSEGEIAAAESYRRAFSHFYDARQLLMSACFQRLDGKPVDADVVYRYRLIDSIADGNAKNLRVDASHPKPSRRPTKSSGLTGYTKRSSAAKRCWRSSRTNGS